MKKIDTSECPVCGSTMIAGGSIDIFGEEAIQEMSCEDCESTWEDTYRIIARRNIVLGQGCDEEC